MNPLNLVLAGTPEFGLPCFDTLLRSNHRITGVWTQPDRMAGRGRQLKQSAVKEWALSHDLPVYQPEHFKSVQAQEELAALKPDLMIVIAYGLILPKSVLTIPRLGCINVHASLLPRWRGASPINHSILHGDEQSGITIMYMDAGMDTGPIISEHACSVSADDTALSLHDRLALLSGPHLLEVIDYLAIHGCIDSTPQDHAHATYANKINKASGAIYWHDAALHIERQIRAYNPWPIAYTAVNNELLRIHQAKVIAQETKVPPGTILSINPEGILVATGQNQLLLERIQFPGKKILSVAQWLHGTPSGLDVGFVFK